MRYVELSEGRAYTVDGLNGPIKVYQNPSYAQFTRLIRDSRYHVLRGQLDGNDFFVWDAAIGTHDDVERHIGGGERVAMNDTLLVVYLDEEETDPDGVCEWFANLPQVRRAFGHKPAVDNYYDHPELHI